jgi:hypothetical protein
MRRWPIGLICVALASVALLWKVRSTASTPGHDEVSKQPTVAEPDHPARGSNLSPAGGSGSREPAATTSETSPAEQAGILNVTVSANDTHRPIAGVRVALIPGRRSDGEGVQRSLAEGFRSPPPDYSKTPRTGPDGRVCLEAPTGVELTLVALNEVEQTTTRKHKIPRLAPGEQRDLTIEIPSGKDSHSFALVLARDNRQPIVGAFARLMPPSAAWDVARLLQPPSTEAPRADTAMSDVAGLLDLLAASRDSRHVVVCAEGYAPALLLAQRIDEPEKAQIVFLDRTATLDLRIVDTNGADVEGAFVELTTEPRFLFQPLETSTVFGSQFGRPAWTVVTTSGGVGRVDRLPPHAPLRVRLARSRDDAAKDLGEMTLEPGERRSIRWTLADS